MHAFITYKLVGERRSSFADIPLTLEHTSTVTSEQQFLQVDASQRKQCRTIHYLQLHSRP